MQSFDDKERIIESEAGESRQRSGSGRPCKYIGTFRQRELGIQ